MKAQDLRDQIMSLLDDVCFSYQGDDVCINPWSPTKIEVGYRKKIKTYTSIDDLMSDKIFNGKSLTDIAPYIK